MMNYEMLDWGLITRKRGDLVDRLQSAIDFLLLDNNEEYPYYSLDIVIEGADEEEDYSKIVGATNYNDLKSLRKNANP